MTTSETRVPDANVNVLETHRKSHAAPYRDSLAAVITLHILIPGTFAVTSSSTFRDAGLHAGNPLEPQSFKRNTFFQGMSATRMPNPNVNVLANVNVNVPEIYRTNHHLPNPDSLAAVISWRGAHKKRATHHCVARGVATGWRRLPHSDPSGPGALVILNPTRHYFPRTPESELIVPFSVARLCGDICPSTHKSDVFIR